MALDRCPLTPPGTSVLGQEHQGCQPAWRGVTPLEEPESWVLPGGIYMTENTPQPLAAPPPRRHP